MGPAIGIDLGTTYTRVAVFRGGKVEIIENETGRRSTPSYVAFTDKGRLVGDPARRQAVMNPKNTIFDIKRLIGRRFDDPTIQDNMSHWPFKVIEVKDKPLIRARLKGKDEFFTPEEISSMLLTKMKEIAEKFLGTEVEDAVISVPANFSDSQRQATMDAGRIAGLNVLRIINEPTAAALAYGLQKNLKEVRNILIYDLGGGTIDVSVVKIYAGGSVFEVKATSGDTHLGGEDFDRRIMNALAQEFENNYKMNIQGDPRAMRHLLIAAESSKRELSSNTTSSISIDMLFGEKDFTSNFSQEDLNCVCNKLFHHTLIHVSNALTSAEMHRNKIDIVVLAGGSTRIPKVQELLREVFPGKSINISINPDEAVVYGAAVQAAILSGKRSEALVIDVSPLTLGYFMLDGNIVKQCIKRNTQVPFKHLETFHTKPGHTQCTFPVIEGESDFVPNNSTLGNLDIEVMPQPTEGKIFVNFELDANCILTVSTEDKNANTVKKVTMSKSGLSEKDIDEMLKKSKLYKTEEKHELERIVMRNSYEALIYETKERFFNGSNVGEDKYNNFLTESLKWLDRNLNATKEEYEERKKRLQEKEKSLISQLKNDKARKHEDGDVETESNLKNTKGQEHEEIEKQSQTGETNEQEDENIEKQPKSEETQGQEDENIEKQLKSGKTNEQEDENMEKQPKSEETNEQEDENMEKQPKSEETNEQEDENIEKQPKSGETNEQEDENMEKQPKSGETNEQEDENMEKQPKSGETNDQKDENMEKQPKSGETQGQEDENIGKNNLDEKLNTSGKGSTEEDKRGRAIKKSFLHLFLGLGRVGNRKFCYEFVAKNISVMSSASADESVNYFTC